MLPGLSQSGFASEEVATTVFGIPFEEIVATWEGGLNESILVVEGRLPGVEAPARYEHRIGGGSGGRLELPPSRVADVAPFLGRFPALAGLTGSGTIGLTATMTGNGEGIRWEGTLQLEDLVLEQPERDLAVSGLGGSLNWFFADGTFTSAPRQRLKFESLRWDEIRTEGGELEFALLSAREWRVDRFGLDWAGGHLSAAGAAFDPTDPDVTVRLRAEGIGLAALLRLAPAFRGRGKGIIDGELSLRIHADGFGLEPGHLALRPGSSGRLQLPEQAWLTGDMSPDQPNYENLRMVERALGDLELRQFRLDFLSEATPGVPLQVTIEGRPLAKDVPAPSISLTLNVHGPIRELGSWALDSGVRIGVQ